MRDFVNNLMTGISVTDIIDILIVAFAIYKLLGFIKQSRAEQLVKGLLLLVLIMFASGLLHLYTIHWILKSALTVGVIMIIIVFQPELRRALEHVGRSKIVGGSGIRIDKNQAKQIVSEFVSAIEYGSDTKTGMLLVIERESSLEDICDTGTVIDSRISSELIGNIFYEGAPLHDGAVIVRGERLYAAGCVLPLTENKSLPKELGTRHRAGIGITENSDALTLIVSEETGIISMVEEGKILRYLELKNVEKKLLELYFNTEKETLAQKIKRMFAGKGEK